MNICRLTEAPLRLRRVLTGSQTAGLLSVHSSAQEAAQAAVRGSSLSAAFWHAVRAGTLVRPVCSACDRSFFTPQVVCPYCLSLTWEYRESSGRGHVYSYTVVHRAPMGGFSTPYVVAIIDLSEGWSMLSNIVNCQLDDVRIGMAVQVAFTTTLEGVCLPVFTPELGGETE
jgi:uncharacterized OB-fold protein